ncbi:MAG: hypothetical protein ACK559_35465 [bacterium]
MEVRRDLAVDAGGLRLLQQLLELRRVEHASEQVEAERADVVRRLLAQRAVGDQLLHRLQLHDDGRVRREAREAPDVLGTRLPGLRAREHGVRGNEGGGK